MRKVLLCIALAGAFVLSAQAIVPRKMVIPNIPGYVSLKGDMHVHTTFSDGSVWPATRVDESMMDDHNFICITDHMDGYLQKNKNAGLFNCDRNTSYKIAATQGKADGILVVHGGEITHSMPPGHFNTLFITDGEPIAKASGENKRPFEDMVEGLKVARSQGAFLVWNHPHWNWQAPNETKWYDEHTKIFKAGLMDGVEIYNECDDYSPEAHHFAVEHNLTLVSGTDCHLPLFKMFDFEGGERRPTTIVFAKEKSLDAIHEALKDRRTAVYADGQVFGYEKWLTPFANEVVKLVKVMKSEMKVTIVLENNSSIPIYLKKVGSDDFTYVRHINIPPLSRRGITIYNLDRHKPFVATECDLNYVIENFFVDANVPLKFPIHVDCSK